MKTEKRGFELLVNETIVKVDQSCINVVKITCASGKKLNIDCDEQHIGIGILRCTEKLTNLKRATNSKSAEELI